MSPDNDTEESCPKCKTGILEIRERQTEGEHGEGYYVKNLYCPKCFYETTIESGYA